MIEDTRQIGERDAIRLDTANKLCQSVSNPADEIAGVFLDEVPGMVEAFGNDANRSHLLPFTTEHGVSPPQSGTIHFQTKGETDMGDKGKKDKGKREQQKKAQLNPKEKRKLKKEKKK